MAKKKVKNKTVDKIKNAVNLRHSTYEQEIWVYEKLFSIMKIPLFAVLVLNSYKTILYAFNYIKFGKFQKENFYYSLLISIACLLAIIALTPMKKPINNDKQVLSKWVRENNIKLLKYLSFVFIIIALLLGLIADNEIKAFLLLPALLIFCFYATVFYVRKNPTLLFTSQLSIIGTTFSIIGIWLLAIGMFKLGSIFNGILFLFACLLITIVQTKTLLMTGIDFVQFFVIQTVDLKIFEEGLEKLKNSKQQISETLKKVSRSLKIVENDDRAKEHLFRTLLIDLNKQNTLKRIWTALKTIIIFAFGALMEGFIQDLWKDGLEQTICNYSKGYFCSKKN